MIEVCPQRFILPNKVTDRYTINRGSKELGTFTYSEMKAAFDKNELLPGDFLFDPRSREWITLETWITKSEKGLRFVSVFLPISVIIIFFLILLIIKNINKIFG